MKNASALAQQVSTCNAMLGTQLFPEDEANLGAYLNATFYKFKWRHAMTDVFCDLAKGKCKPCEGGVPPLSDAEVARLLAKLKGWQVVDGKLCKEFSFPDHYVTMTFVNAIAWVSHQQGHHPDLTLGYNTCRVEYVTHAINGLSESDFICAAKIDALFEL